MAEPAPRMVNCGPTTRPGRQNITHENKSRRQPLLDKLLKLLSGIPTCNTLLLAGDLNSPLLPDRLHVGPCVLRGPKLKVRSTKPLQKLIEDHHLVALNTWSCKKPATHEQGNSISQIDFVFARTMQATNPEP